ncbi:MAG: hypothetical protein IH845_04760 [Nanoarchaeota archaeon]|nr:hypothetical protein [Nanoarchaeota archaeon]
MKPIPLTPRSKINSEGKIAYSESFQAWNTIKLKKEIFSEFPQLKEKRSKFSYKLIYHRDPKELEEAIRAIIKRKEEVMPILLFMYKE